MNSIVEILIDISGSMGRVKGKEKLLLPDGSTRISLVKKLLAEDVIPILDYSSHVVVRTFRTSKVNNRKVNSIKRIYDGEYDQNDISEAIHEIDETNGGTPITAALKLSLKNLKQFKGDDRKVILITDGQENGGGDYLQTIKDAKKDYGIPFSVFIVGINQSFSAANKCITLAKDTKGNYLNLKSKDYEHSEVSSALSNFKTSILANSVNNLTKTDKNRDVQETSDDDERNNEELRSSDIKEIVNNNAQAINVISKQLSIISAEINQMRSYDRQLEDEDIFEDRKLNEDVRVNSETFVYDELTKMYQDRVVWFNKDGESHSSCDFHIVNPDESIEYYIECKASKNKTYQFLMTDNEWDVFLKNTRNYQIYFVANALSNPELIVIDNLLHWILSGLVVPFSESKQCLKAGRILFTIK